MKPPTKFELMRNNRHRAAPVPVEPKDEAAELKRQFIESTRALAAMAARIEKLEAT